ncbi:hypothetical protein BJ165DRAFT_1339324, partial [Panaeolus papilionaceus]
RGLDPILGVFTGVFAYYLHETHPRNDIHKQDRLVNLLRWKYAQYQDRRRVELQALEK